MSKESLEITTLRFPFFLANVPPSQDIINLGKTYRKPLIDLEGQFLFGELAILKYLENYDWNGVWIDTFHGRNKKLFWEVMPHIEEGVLKGKVDLPEKANTIYEKIRAKNTENKRSTAGFFDVFVWKGEDYAFLDYKGKGDKVRKSQWRWINAARDAGIQVKQLFFVSF